MAWVNLPSGSSTLSSYAFNSLPTDGGAAVDGWFLSSSRSSLITDATEPESPSSCLRFTYEVGFPAGIGPGNFYRQLSNLNEVFFGYTWKPSNPWQNESQSNVNKISFLVSTSNKNEIIMTMYGPGPTNYTLRTHVQTIGANNTGVNGSVSQNPLDGGQIFWKQNGSITLGNWYRIECYAKKSTTSTSQDGIVRVWLNGTQVCNCTNVNFVNEPWSTFFLSPTWGGANNTKTQEDYYDFGHVIVADTSNTTPQEPGTSGLLQGSRTTPTFPVNLSSVGLTDWIKWGRVATSSIDRKSGANVLNSTLTNIGGGSYFQYTSALSTYSWSGGTPTATASGVTGSLMTQASSAGPGFQLIVPADTTQRTLKFYGTLYGVSARLTATLSDSSAAAFSDTITATTTAVPVVYTLTYKAGSASQSVTLKWEATAATENPGNLTWHAVTLTNDGTTLQAPTITSFTPSNGLVGSSVTITGTNFDALTTNNTVAFNGTTATVSTATTTSLVVTVPSGATTGTITVTTAGGTATSSGSYTVDSPPEPETPPESGQGGSAMMILMMP